MNRQRRDGNWGLFLIVLYMLLDYARPQNIAPGLAPLHVPMLVQIAIIFTLLACRFERLKSKESILFFLLVCLMAFHVPFAVNNYWAYQTTRTMALQFIVFLAVCGFLSSFEKLNLALVLWIIVAILCGIAGYLQEGKIPGSDFLGDENDYSLFLNMMIPLTFFAATSARSKGAKVFFFSGVVILILGATSSMSRGGFLGMIPPIAYCWWKTPNKIKTALAGGFIAVFLFVAVIPSEYWTEIKTIRTEGIRTGTGSQRAYLWKYGYQMFRDHPLIGIGPQNFNWNLSLYEPAEGFNGRSQAGRPSHSIYFTMLPELGLIGTFLFFYLISVNQLNARSLQKDLENIMPFNRKYEQNQLRKISRLRAFSHGLTGAIIAYLISGAFLSVLYYGHFWLILAFSTVTNRLLKEQLLEMEQVSRMESAPHESRSDRWQFARSVGDYPFSR